MDEVNTKLSESIQNNIVYDRNNFTNTKLYFKYLYLLARDHMNDSKLKDKINNTIEHQFVGNYLFIEEIIELDLDEILYLISLLCTEDRISSISITIDALTYSSMITNKIIREKNIELLKKIFNSLITSTKYVHYLIRGGHTGAIYNYLDVLLPSYDEVESVLDKYSNNSNSDYNASLNVLRKYMDKIILNQV